MTIDGQQFLDALAASEERAEVAEGKQREAENCISAIAALKGDNEAVLIARRYWAERGVTAPTSIRAKMEGE